MNPHYRQNISRSPWATPTSILREQGLATPAPPAPTLDPLAQPHQDANHSQPVTKKARRNERSAWAQTLNENRGQAGSRVQTDEVQGGLVGVNDTAAHEMLANAQLAELVRTDPALEPLLNKLHQYREMAQVANHGVEATLKAICQHLDSTNQADEQRLNAMRTQVAAPTQPQEALTLAQDPTPVRPATPAVVARAPILETTTLQAPAPALVALGYSHSQALRIKPQAQAAVIKHHAALSSLGFSHDQIVMMSDEPRSLALSPDRTIKPLFQALPDLTLAQFVDIAKKTPNGSLAIHKLLEVGKSLKRKPLELTTEQIVSIAQGGMDKGLRMVHSLGHQLASPPVSMTSAQITRYASSAKGIDKLARICQNLPAMYLRFSPLHTGDLIEIASLPGGGRMLNTLGDCLPALLLPPFSLSRQTLLKLGKNTSDVHAPKAILENLPTLISHPYAMDREVILNIASHQGEGCGGRGVTELKQLLDELTRPPFNTDIEVLKNMESKPSSIVTTLRDFKEFMLEQMSSSSVS